METNLREITCVSSIKKGLDVLSELHNIGIYTANRSVAKGESNSYNEPVEMEIISVIIQESQSDEIFQKMYELCEIDKQHNGIIFETTVKKGSKYQMPQEV